MRGCRLGCLSFAFLFWLVGASNVHAGLFSGTIYASFSNPALSGYYVDASGQLMFLDASATALWDFSPPSGGSEVTLTTGNDAGGTGAPSTITFRGNAIVDQPGNVEFALGTLDYFNGTSTLGTGIFGATLTLWLEGDSSVLPISVDFSLLGTVNTDDPIQSADYLEFPSPLNVRFHVLEGVGASATLYGQIYGDPELRLLGLADPTPGGFLTAIPEPSTGMLSGIALVATWVATRRRLSSKNTVG